MAKQKGKYEQLYHDLFSSNSPTFNTVAPSKITQTEKQIKNTKTKLTKAGIKAGQQDTRNPVEKLLNLTPDQGILLDVFELLNRPQQALFGALNVHGKDDLLTGALKGLKGEETLKFKDLIMSAVPDSPGGILSDRKGKLDLVDVLGLAGDIALDPMNWKVVPTNVTKMVDGINEVSTVMRSPTSMAFQGIGKGIKGAAGLADKGIEKALIAADKQGVRNFGQELAQIVYNNPGAKTADALGKRVLNYSDITQGVPFGRLETYKEAKTWLSRAFDASKSMPRKALEAIRKRGVQGKQAIAELNIIRTQLHKDLKEGATNILKKYSSDPTIKNIMGGGLDENMIKTYSELLSNDILHAKEYQRIINGVETGAQIIQRAQDGALRASDEVINYLQEVAKEIHYVYPTLDLNMAINELGIIDLKDGWSKIGKGVFNELELTSELLNRQFPAQHLYSADDLMDMERLYKTYVLGEGDKVFKELFDKISPIFDKGNMILDKNLGTGLSTTYLNNESYVRHALDKKAFSHYDRIKDFVDDGTTRFKGDFSVLGQRKYQMSVKEANNLYLDILGVNYDSLDSAGKKFFLERGKLFKDDILASFDDYLMNVPKESIKAGMIDDILLKQTFGDWEKTKELNKTLKEALKSNQSDLIEKTQNQINQLSDNLNMKILTRSDPRVPVGFKALSETETAALRNKLAGFQEQYGMNSFESFINLLDRKGTKIAINDEIMRMLEVTDPKNVHSLVRMYDVFLNAFKRNKTLSASFQMNNVIGNTTNLALGGVTPTKQFKLYPEAIKILKNIKGIQEKVLNNQPITGKEKEMYDIWSGFIGAGFGDPELALDLADMPPNLKAYFTGQKKFETIKDFIVDGLPYINNELNNRFDNLSRLVAYIEGTRNPEFLLRLGANDAADAVRKMLFDPRDLTQFEKDWMKRIIPFYTFTKKNLAYHIQNLGKNGERYANLVKGVKELSDIATGGNYDNMADYIKDNLYIPVPSLGKNGEYRVMRVQLPFGDVVDLFSDPIGNIAGMTTPPARAMYELATNKQAFTGQPIEKFSGELSTNIPQLTKKQEYLLGQMTGLDVPLKQVSRFAEGGGVKDPLQGMADVVSMRQNINTDKLYKLYDELEKLENIMQQYKQKGVKFSTINELKRANSNKVINDLMAKLNSLGK